MKLFRPLLATTAAVMAAAYVPPHMELPAGWTDVASATVRSENAASNLPSALRLSRLSVHRSDYCLTFCFWNIYPAQLIPLEFRSKTAAALEGADSPIVSESLCMSAADVISKHSGEYGCIAFAIRRPGKIQYIAVRCGELSCTLYLTTLILY